MVESVYLDVRQFSERSGLPVAFIEKLVTDKKLVAHVVGRKRVINSDQLQDLETILRGGEGSDVERPS